ncbi:MAG TPA: glycine zipper domain-containing protein [Lacunisphaera sp.]|jgi:uncharacterized protein YcfJ|nr:glycine zipper domain-containing protein [Lacunisphaera sp.]
MKPTILIPSLIALALAGGCATTERAYDEHPRAARSAGIGAATGAVIGGIIGHQSGETAAGAALGAAAGGIAGGAYGASQERTARRSDTPADRYGFTNGDYLALMTDDEMRTLEARAPNRSGDDLANYLTDQEKENLRRRSNNRQPIGG